MERFPTRPRLTSKLPDPRAVPIGTHCAHMLPENCKIRHRNLSSIRCAARACFCSIYSAISRCNWKGSKLEHQYQGASVQHNVDHRRCPIQGNKRPYTMKFPRCAQIKTIANIGFQNNASRHFYTSILSKTRCPQIVPVHQR